MTQRAGGDATNTRVNNEFAVRPFKRDEQKIIDDEEINISIANHAAQAGWVYAELHHNLSIWADRMNTAFFERKLPTVALSIDYSQKNTLGWYRIGRDGMALKWRINLNLRHAARGIEFFLSVLLHELIHLWEDIIYGPPAYRNNYHGARFRNKAAELGIPCTRKGGWLTPDKNGRFCVLLLEYGIDPVWDVCDYQNEEEKTSTLTPWTCRCTRVQVARMTTLFATCSACGEKFLRG